MNTSKENDAASDKLRLENQLCFPLYAAARKVVSLYTPYFRELGITYTQYIVFLVLWEKKEITVGELGSKRYLDSGTLTPLIKKLEKEGYIERSRSTDDERVVLVSLTEKGAQLREKAECIPSEVGGCIPLSLEEAMTLYTLLYKLLGGLQ